MKLKKLFAGVLAGAMVLGCMVMPVGADNTATGGSVSLDSSWWSAYNASERDLLANTGVALGAVTSITTTSTFTGNWGVYHESASGEWTQAYQDGGSVTIYASEEYLGDFTTTFDWSCFGIWISDADKSSQDFDFTFTYSDTYTDANTIVYYIEEADLAHSGYVLTLTNSDDQTATMEGDSYSYAYDENGDPYYWVGVTLSDIPYNQEVAITGIEFVD